MAARAGDAATGPGQKNKYFHRWTDLGNKARDTHTKTAEVKVKEVADFIYKMVQEPHVGNRRDDNPFEEVQDINNVKNYGSKLWTLKNARVGKFSGAISLFFNPDRDGNWEEIGILKRCHFLANGCFVAFVLKAVMVKEDDGEEEQKFTEWVDDQGIPLCCVLHAENVVGAVVETDGATDIFPHVKEYTEKKEGHGEKLLSYTLRGELGRVVDDPDGTLKFLQKFFKAATLSNDRFVGQVVQTLGIVPPSVDPAQGTVVPSIPVGAGAFRYWWWVVLGVNKMCRVAAKQSARNKQVPVQQLRPVHGGPGAGGSHIASP